MGLCDDQPDAKTRQFHYDWLEAGEHTQRTVAYASVDIICCDATSLGGG
jgi:hypothetical protein